MPVYSCPKGHQSSESDFCSECGARIQGASQDAPFAGLFSSSPPPAGSNSAQACPDCGAPRSDRSSKFCEICGYNFSTGAHGNISETPPLAVAATPPPVPPIEPGPVPEPPLPEPPAPAPAPEPTVPEPAAPEPAAPEPAREWSLVAAIDPSLAEPGGPTPPGNVDPITVKLEKPVSLIGRKSEKRAILPEVSLDVDDGVSHRHALVTRGDDGSLTLRDIGSANGTRLNGSDVAPLADVPLHDGDQITLGRWSRLTVKSV